MATRIIHEGHFNTGRMYSSAGQRIYWWCDDDAVVTFYDLDRMIVGVLDRHEYPEHVTPRWLMDQYDNGRYSMGCQPAPLPEDVDFGPRLNI